jgi:hypothetical protein
MLRLPAVTLVPLCLLLLPQTFIIVPCVVPTSLFLLQLLLPPPPLLLLVASPPGAILCEEVLAVQLHRLAFD